VFCGRNFCQLATLIINLQAPVFLTPQRLLANTVHKILEQNFLYPSPKVRIISYPIIRSRYILLQRIPFKRILIRVQYLSWLNDQSRRKIFHRASIILF
jgi:hypothetical protein